MLLYDNKRFFWLLLNRRGSVFYRCDSLVGGLFVAALGGAIQYMHESEWEDAPSIGHHYGLQALGVAVTWAIVFRTNLAWTRYWEAVTQLHVMYSKWADAFSQFYGFSEVTLKAAKEKKDEEKVKRIILKQRRLKVNFALLSAMAAERLSNGDNQLIEEMSRKVRSRSAMRVEKELKGTGLPSMVAKKDFDRELRTVGSYVLFCKPSEQQIELLKRSNDAVSLVMYWILWDLASVMKDIDTAPPIQSRMYQELSNGMLGFNNCLKIADVPFPLPFAQLLLLLLVAFSVLIPLYVIVFTKSRVVGPILCFFLFESLWCLNEVAKELENPFGQDMNDISLPDFHLRFVDNLETVSHCEQRQMLDPGDDFNAVDLRSLANQPPLEVAALAATVDTTKLRL
ncbi:unnamed protein product [Cladocopium goreaui]|uniref:SET domain-containing protein n=1 Tax=Cladocopium goreaui TaxID=2562237 RepID=A0A9P1FE03_9DINO|nr:unnamed protein product [Cladocopium goreaui]